MQVNFCGILRTYVPAENPLHVPVQDRYNRLKGFEDTLNCKKNVEYNDRDKNKIRLFAKRIIRDYEIPEKGVDNPRAGVYRIAARDAIYYCTGQDIEAAKAKKHELNESNLSLTQKADEMQKFVDERTKDDNMGFITLQSKTGHQFDTIGMGECKDGRFNCDFLYL